MASYRYWLLVLFVLVIPLPAQGQEPCYNNSWTFHRPTHTCFKLIRRNKNWTAARDYCAGIQLGRRFGVVTRLAKSDDKMTNNFISGMLPEGWQVWIGLHKANGQFKWDGYPDQKPKFSHSTWTQKSKPYVSMHRKIGTGNQWVGEEGNKKIHFVCQQEGIKPHQATFMVSNKEINGSEAILVQGSDDVIITCTLDTGNPAVTSTTLLCDAPITNGITTQNTVVTPTSYAIRIGQVKRDMDERKCTCWGQHLTGRTDNSTLTLKVLTKPNKVTCQTDLHADKLLFSCQTNKISPQALCTFSYRNQGEVDFNPVSSNDDIIQYSHEDYTDNDGLLYYQSHCSVTLKTDTVTFSPGNLTVRVTVNPNIEGIDQDTTSDAFVTTTKTVNIVVPDKPQFQRLDQTLDSSSLIQYHENDSMDLRCQVQSGNPSVYSVTLSCQFPFTDSNQNNQHMMSGTDYVINETASRDMDAKSCICIGNHLTEAIESSPLTFDITYPAELRLFNVNGRHESLTEVEANEKLTLSCEADGNPKPSVQIRKLESSYLDTSTWQSDQSESQVNTTLVAQCEHNGRYSCSVGNTVNNLEDTQEVDIRVRCPPTYCNETSRDIKIAVRSGTSQTVSLCVVAYPMPVLTPMKKESNSGWSTLQDFGGQITQVTRFDSHQSVTINFQVLDSSHLGQYALANYVGNGVTSSDLHFQLTAPLSHCHGEEKVGHEVKLGQPLNLSMCVTAFPKPATLMAQIANGSDWLDLTDTITMGVDFDTLTNVMVVIPEVKAADLGQYRLFDPSDAKRLYLHFSLSDKRLPRESGADTNAGLIVGAVLSVIVIILIIVIIVLVFILRRRTKRRDAQKESTFEDDRTDPNNARQRLASHTNAAKDDLVYIQLDFDCTTDKKAKSQKKMEAKSKRKDAKETIMGRKDEERTEYAAVSATATIKIRREMEKKEEEERKKKEEDKERDEVEEEEEDVENVYENVQTRRNVQSRETHREADR